MQISAKPHRAALIQDSSGECLLHFSCTALDDSGVLEIGTGYVFASKNNRRILNKRHSCELEVRVKRRSSLREAAIAKLKLSENKVGELSFCPSTKADELTPSRKAVLDASLFVDDQLYESIMRTLLSGRQPESLELDLEGKDVLKYGWEPDGSRIEWKTSDDPSAISTVEVERISLVFHLFASQH